MKKITALSLCLTIILSLTFSVRAEETTTEMSKAERFMTGSGIFSIKYEPEEDITRAEFAAVLSNALHLLDDDSNDQTWYDNVLGSDKTQSEVTINNNLFDDVDASHPYYREIQAVKQHGVMVGISEHLFAPEYSITLKEAQKVILTLMGYGAYADWYGGYPSGYIKAAQNIGLINGITCSEDDAVTQKDVINLLYNALDINLIEVTDIYTKEYKTSDETFMSGILKIGKEKGTITDNGYTSLDGDSKIPHGNIKINSLTAKLANGAKSALNYLGRAVELYYRTDDNDENTAIYVEELTTNETITFDIDDFESLSNNRISYRIDGKLYTKTLNNDAEMIMNNELCDYFDASTFDFADGDVTLTNNNNGYNTIIVNKYEYAVVSNVDNEKMYIYNKLTGGSAAARYDFSGEDVEKECIVILNEKSEDLSFSDISVGDILNIKKSHKYMEIIRDNNIINQFAITGFTADNDKSTYVSGNTSYSTSEFFEKLENRPKVNNSEKYNLYLNKFGEIIWMELSGDMASDSKMGLLVQATSTEEEDDAHQRLIKIYNDESKFEWHFVAKTIRVNGRTKKFENLLDTLKAAIGEIVIYKCNKDGVLNDITIPNAFGNEEELGWYKIAPKGSYRYENQGKALSTMFFYGDNTKVFTMPENESDYTDVSKFSVNKTTFSEENYTLQPYAYNKDSVTADAILLRKEAGKGGTVKEGEAFLISEIVNTVNDDDEPVLLFKGYKFKTAENAKYTEYIVSEDAVMVGFGEVGTPIDPNADINEVGPRTYKELEAGDIIYFALNSSDEIDTIRTAYDRSNRKPFNASRGDDFYDPANAGVYASPVDTTWSGTLISRVNYDLRIATNYDPQSINYSDFTDVEKNVKTAVIRNTGSIVKVKTNARKLSVEPGKIADILTYKETGAADTADDVVVLAYFRSYNYGTIIYKK